MRDTDGQDDADGRGAATRDVGKQLQRHGIVYTELPSVRTGEHEGDGDGGRLRLLQAKQALQAAIEGGLLPTDLGPVLAHALNGRDGGRDDAEGGVAARDERLLIDHHGADRQRRAIAVQHELRRDQAGHVGQRDQLEPFRARQPELLFLLGKDVDPRQRGGGDIETGSHDGPGLVEAVRQDEPDGELTRSEEDRERIGLVSQHIDVRHQILKTELGNQGRRFDL